MAMCTDARKAVCKGGGGNELRALTHSATQITSTNKMLPKSTSGSHRSSCEEEHSLT
jgi:hypothetical protein